MIVLSVNGKEQRLEKPTSILSYLESLGVNLETMAVGHNGIVLRRGELLHVTLSDGDRVEIVRAVGGG
jgi:sulfur carrier protein